MATTLHLKPPFRADHIGSLKRPAELLEKRQAFENKECSAEQLRELEDAAILEIVKMQREVGIKSITDGEFRRHMFFDGVFDNMDGMTYIPVVPMDWFMDYVPDLAAFKQWDFKGAASYICEGKLERTRPFYVPQFEALKKFTSPEEHPYIKITMCAPEWFHLRHGPYAYKKDVYANDEEYFADIAIAYQQEIKALYEAGCREHYHLFTINKSLTRLEGNIQFDDPLLAYFCAESMITGMVERGIDHEALLDSYIRAYNNCLKGRPTDMNVGLHLCRGNFKNGMHFSEGGYDRIAIKLFNQINVDCYYLEYDTERAGNFEPLKYLPKNKSVVLGLVTSKFAPLEDKAELKSRVLQAAELISQGVEKRPFVEALNQICISPQCGFASHAEGNAVSAEVVRRKLSLVVETSKEIWGDH